jgi:hypothetical protein
VRIDFGDGRKLETTITGNSIHYVLDADGRVLDALPGLYGPQAFLRSLVKAQAVHTQIKGLDLNRRIQTLNNYHRTAIGLLTTEWIQSAHKAGGRIPGYLIPRVNPDGTPRAIEIAPLAVTKSGMEINILRVLTRDAEALGKVTEEDTWKRIALQHIPDAKLDERSLGLIKRQTQELLQNKDNTVLTADVKLTNLVQKLQMDIALDTIRNEYMLHNRLHAWLATDLVPADVEKLNERVYAELFLTPKSDPWLGLFSPNTYTALDRGGVTPK